MRRRSSSDLSLRGSYHKVTGLISSPRHHLGPCLGKLSPTPPVEEQGQPSPARRGGGGALPPPPQLWLPPESADAEPGGLSRGPAIAVSFASSVWQGSRAAHGAPA